MFERLNPILAAIAVVGLSSGTGYLMSVDGKSLVDSASKRSLQTFYGLYGDVQDDGTTKVNTETLKLRFSNERLEVTGEITGPEKFEGKIIQRNWKIGGFFRDRLLVLNILTEQNPQDPKPPTGIGTYYLNKESEDAYTGTALYLDCGTQHKVFQCPYALSATELSLSQARAKWPALFTKQCEPVDLFLGAQHASLQC
jgi:hypothetical protein